MVNVLKLFRVVTGGLKYTPQFEIAQKKFKKDLIRNVGIVYSFNQLSKVPKGCSTVAQA